MKQIKLAAKRFFKNNFDKQNHYFNKMIDNFRINYKLVNLKGKSNFIIDLYFKILNFENFESLNLIIVKTFLLDCIDLNYFYFEIDWESVMHC